MPHNVLDVLVSAYEQDPVGAGALIDDVVASVLEEQAEINGPMIDRMLGAFVAQQTAVAKRELARSYVSKAADGEYPDDEVMRVAQWLSGIESYVVKSFGPENKWEEKEHPRDARGRFVRGVSQRTSVDPLQRPINSVSPNLRNSIRRNGDGSHQWVEGTSDSDRQVAAHHQAQYQETDKILRSFANTFGNEKSDVMAIITGADPTGAFKHKYIKLSEADKHGADSVFRDPEWGKETNVISVEVAPTRDAKDTTVARVNQYNRLGEVGGDALARVAMLSPDQRSAITDVLKPSDPEKGALSTLFGRISSGGKVFDSMGNKKLAALSEFVGTMGPEALTVMEPHVLRSSYRYRGTEKQPDRELRGSFYGKQMEEIDLMAADPDRRGSITDFYDKATAPTEPGKPRRLGAVGMSVGSAANAVNSARSGGRDLTEDDMKMTVRADVATNHLLSTIPLDPLIAELSRKSGDILPSHGILIDADGDLVSQSVGVSDDTYLPFDFSNLGRLRGGQYVRTRQAGGITGEDIATAVRFGSRRVTVASSSGVFTLDFDPNFRGGRSMSLRAQEMYNRYLKILDAVENSGLYSKDIPPAQKASLRVRAREETGAREGTEAFNTKYNELLANARSDSATLTEDEITAIERQAEDEVKSDPRSPEMSNSSYRRLVEDRFDELHSKRRAEKASQLKLNSEGYRVALETLQQQFPYFIRSVKQENLKDFLRDRGQPTLRGSLRSREEVEDKGYMRPGGLRASGLQSGYYKVDRGMEPKRKEEPKAYAAQSGADGTASAGGGGPASAPEPGAPSALPSSPSAPAPTSGQPAPPAPADAAAPAQNSKPFVSDMYPITTTLGHFKDSFAQRGQAATNKLDSAFDNLRTNVKNGLPPGGQLQIPAYTTTATMDQLVQRGMLTSLQSMQPDEREKVLIALMDYPSVVRALRSLASNTTAGGVSDWLSSQGGFMGTKDLDEAALRITREAQIASDTGLLAAPFTALKSGNDMLSHKGPRAQAFPDLRNVDDGEKLKALVDDLDSKDSPIPQIARDLAKSSYDDTYVSIGEMSQRLSDRVLLMENIGQIQTEMKQKKLSSMAAANAVLSKHGVTRERADDVLVWATGTYEQADRDKEIMATTPALARSKTADLQIGYSLAMTARAIEAVKSENTGGDVIGPKDVAHQVLVQKSHSSPHHWAHSISETRAMLGLRMA